MMNEASSGDEHIRLPPVAAPMAAPLTIKWIEIRCGVSQAWYIKTHFQQIRLERAQHTPISQNKYSIVIHASKGRKTLLLKLLYCYGNLRISLNIL